MTTEPVELDGILLELEIWLYELLENCGCKLWPVFPDGLSKNAIGGGAQPPTSPECKMPIVPVSGCCAAAAAQETCNYVGGKACKKEGEALSWC